KSTNKTRINKVDNITLESIKKVIDMDHIDQRPGPSFENSSEVISKRALNALKPEEKIVGNEALDKSNHEMLTVYEVNKVKNPVKVIEMLDVIQSIHIDIENNKSNGKLLVSEINDEKKDKKIDDLPELDREVIQNIKWTKM
ncbi:38297_t:CDS:2, partial [Gigaspora margarita]